MNARADEGLQRYLDGIERSMTLCADAEYDLIARWRESGDRTARDAVLRAHLPRVVWVARHRYTRNLELDERVAEGNLGLVHALDRFDAERGVRFWTYAVHWVQVFIQRAARRRASIVTGGLDRDVADWARVERIRRSLPDEAKDAWRSAVAEQTGWTGRRIDALASRFAAPDVALDGLEAPEVPATEALPDVTLEAKRRAEAVRRALDEVDLSARERIVITERLYTCSGEERTLEAIAGDLGCSREWVRKLETMVKGKLRRRLVALGVV